VYFIEKSIEPNLISLRPVGRWYFLIFSAGLIYSLHNYTEWNSIGTAEVSDWYVAQWRDDLFGNNGNAQLLAKIYN